ncbi:MAG TPA: extracellular solute-binding protein, partial [Pyrinomonadaceae bacterium]|nr:extracellular solute-binding protein [Pyrinomonadaceae bacterium]
MKEARMRTSGRTKTTAILAATILLAGGLVMSACLREGKQHSRSLTLAINSGVEGDALKQAAKDYETQTGVHINIAEFPYANLFEKELIDLNARTGAYDLIMLDDPWFTKFASLNVLTDLGPLLQKRGRNGPDDDFVATSIGLCRHPY